MTTRFGALASGSTIESVVAAAGGGSGATQALMETRTAAAAATIDVGVKSLRTAGYSAPGDGGQGLYARMQSAPSNPVNKGYFRSVDRVRADGTTNATHGGYWEAVPVNGCLSIEQFGAAADAAQYSGTGGTDNYQPIVDAINYTPFIGDDFSNYTPMIVFGLGNYRVSATIMVQTLVQLKGLSTNLDQQGTGSASNLYFPPDTTGFIFLGRQQTGEAGNTGPELTAGGSIIEGLALHGSGTDTTKTAIKARCRIKIRHCWVTGFGRSIFIIANAWHDGVFYGGNANGCVIEGFESHSCQFHHLHIAGSDANACFIYDFFTHGRTIQGGCGIFDESGLGNYYYGLHIEGYADGGVFWDGALYQANTNDNAALKATTPGTNEQVWGYLKQEVAADAQFPLWSASNNHHPQRPILIAGASNASTVVGWYQEAGTTRPHNGGSTAISMEGTAQWTNASNTMGVAGTFGGIGNRKGFGGWRPHVEGGPGYANHGSSMAAWVGAASSGGDPDLSMELWGHHRGKDDQRYFVEYAFDDMVSYQRFNSKRLWEHTTVSSLRDFGRSAPVDDMMCFRDIGHINDEDPNEARIHGLRGAAPTTGSHSRGEVVWNQNPSAGGFAGWICTTSGTPGTWKTFGAITA